MLDSSEILVFVRVVQAGSFTAAGKLLQIPKSTVSRKVAQLEERLGARLLHRTTRSLRLTETGRAYFDRCTVAIEQLEAAERAVAELSAEPRGALRVTAPVELGQGFLGPVIRSYLLRYAKTKVEVTLTDRLVDLVAEGIDLALRAGPLPDSSLVAQRLPSLARVLCASSGYLSQHGEPSSWSQLADHRCLIFRAGIEGSGWVSSSARPLAGTKERATSGFWLRASGRAEARRVEAQRVEVSGPVIANNYDVLREAALAGVGIALLPEFRCADDLRTGRLQRLLPELDPVPIELHALFPTARYVPLKLRAFVELLREHCSASSPKPPQAD